MHSDFKIYACHFRLNINCYLWHRLILAIYGTIVVGYLLHECYWPFVARFMNLLIKRLLMVHGSWLKAHGGPARAPDRAPRAMNHE